MAEIDWMVGKVIENSRVSGFNITVSEARLKMAKFCICYAESWNRSGASNVNTDLMQASMASWMI